MAPQHTTPAGPRSPRSSSARPTRRRPKINRSPHRVPLAPSARRLHGVIIAMAIALSICAGRALQLQAFDSRAYAAQAARQMSITKPLPATRGSITDRYGNVMALSIPAVDVIADPTIIATNGVNPASLNDATRAAAAAAPGKIAALAETYLGGKAADYLPKLTKAGSRYVVIAKQVRASDYTRFSNALQEQNLAGIYRESHPMRSYPGETVAANVVGFVDNTGKGASGIEYMLDDQLAGTPGREMYQTSPNGKIPLGANVVTPKVDGTSYQTTIDAELQLMVERRIAKAVTAARAKSGTVIVQNVKTGEILAMANYPSFDANNPGDAVAGNLGNRAVTDAYEPGSIQKVLTMAALADAGIVTAGTKVKVPGEIMSGGAPIKDSFSHSDMGMYVRGVVRYSSNVGTVIVTRQLDKAKLPAYLSSFGLGRKTGLGLPGEATGFLPPATLSGATRDQIAFGQGLSVTAVQEASAISGIVNDGVYNAPTIIKSSTGPDGKTVAAPAPQPRRIISSQASAEVVDMMNTVVTTRPREFTIPSYNWLAKSGTSEKFQTACHCYRGYTASFVGVAPYEDPQILVYSVIDEPRSSTHSGTGLSAPVVKDILRLALPRYGVEPRRSAAPVRPVQYSLK